MLVGSTETDMSEGLQNELKEKSMSHEMHTSIFIQDNLTPYVGGSPDDNLIINI